MPKCFEYGELGLGTSAIYSFGDFFVCEGGWYKGIKRCEKRSQIMSQLPHMKKVDVLGKNRRIRVSPLSFSVMDCRPEDANGP